MFAKFALLLMLFAQAKETAPVISDPLKLKFFKAQSEYQQAQVIAQQAATAAKAKQDAYQAVVTEFQKTCGDKFQPQMDKAGDPVCVAK